MWEQLVAWAGDCVVMGTVELGEGRLSDQLNERETVTFHDATLRALDDGHEVAVGELEVERGELHVIEVRGRRGDPARRLRTVEERVRVELGPFVVTGNLHRPPHTQPLASLSRWARFVPMTDALIVTGEGENLGVREEVVLLNRDRIGRTMPTAVVPVFTRPAEQVEEPAQPVPAPAGQVLEAASPG